MQKSSPKILIDITHTAQFNFYVNIIKELSKNYFLIITVLNRGKLPQIAKNELSEVKNINIKILGKKRPSKWSTIFEANIFRVIKLLFISLGKNIKLSFANGWHPSIVGRLLGIPSITFDDDPQVYDYRIKLALANKVYYCLYQRRFASLHQKAKILRTVKEWAYLSMNTFEPNPEILSYYQLEPKKYLFIREVSTNTINYSKQHYGRILDISKDIPRNYQVIFSLEDKSKKDLYPKDWILLEEPIKDIHSLIYYSKLLISSGDSMAREAAVMGLPGIYIGSRKMYVNHVLADLADFYHFESGNFKILLKEILKKTSHERQKSTRNILNSEFIDINRFANKITKAIIK